VCCAVLIGTVKFGPFSNIAPSRVFHTLLLGLLTAASNLLAIEPATTKNLFQRYDLENSGAANPELRKKLGKEFGTQPTMPAPLFTLFAMPWSSYLQVIRIELRIYSSDLPSRE
jgi:hypothetical protein